MCTWQMWRIPRLPRGAYWRNDVSSERAIKVRRTRVEESRALLVAHKVIERHHVGRARVHSRSKLDHPLCSFKHRMDAAPAFCWWRHPGAGFIYGATTRACTGCVHEPRIAVAFSALRP